MGLNLDAEPQRGAPLRFSLPSREEAATASAVQRKRVVVGKLKQTRACHFTSQAGRGEARGPGGWCFKGPSHV